MRARDVMYQNDGEVTKAYYATLGAAGPIGEIAVAIFRAQKRSSRAKDYRRGKYRAAAYDVKNWSMGEVCRLLTAHAENLGIDWGWQEDPSVVFGEQASWVLYVDLPNVGQCSFHSPNKLAGKLYSSKWDGERGVGEDRTISFCDMVLGIPPEAVRSVPDKQESANCTTAGEQASLY